MYAASPPTRNSLPRDPVRGQGLASTMWKGCLVICPATRGDVSNDWKSSVLDGAEGDGQEKRYWGALPPEAGPQ